MSSQYTPPLPEQSRGTSVPHLVMGLVFLGLAGSWVLHEVGVIESVQVQWLLPLILVVAGAAGLLASLTHGLPRSTPTSDEDSAQATSTEQD
jgi:hypothetical protein